MFINYPMSIKKFYYYLHYRIYHFVIKISDDALNEWKSGALITCIECALVGEIIIWLQAFNIFSKEKIDFLWSTPILIMIAAVVGFTNYYIFLYKIKWKKYSKEFATYSNRTRFWNDILVLSIIVFTLVSLIFSIWVLYHR